MCLSLEDLLPHFNNSIPTTSKHRRWIHWMPNCPNTRTLIMRMILLQHPRSLKVPKIELAITIPTANKSSIGTNGYIARISRDIVSLHLFLSLETIPISRLVYHDAIVETLAYQVLFAGVHGNYRHGMHRGIGNVLDGYTNVPFPDQHFFIITGGYHLGAIIFNECNGVDGCQMMIVLLGDFPRGGIVSDNFIIRTSHNKCVIIMGVKFHHIRNATIGIRSQHLATLCIPQPQVSIKRRRYELGPIVIKLHIPHGRTVSHIGPHALFLLHAPNLARPIQSRA
mmetsp:Transcript_6218/g.14075  ORF Transcript_6218/g.14075 Transcript_6218/m.14075 type:complete len:282 (+) Transcript_6218:47-892(+)